MKVIKDIEDYIVKFDGKFCNYAECDWCRTQMDQDESYPICTYPEFKSGIEEEGYKPLRHQECINKFGGLDD